MARTPNILENPDFEFMSESHTDGVQRVLRLRHFEHQNKPYISLSEWDYDLSRLTMPPVMKLNMWIPLNLASYPKLAEDLGKALIELAREMATTKAEPDEYEF